MKRSVWVGIIICLAVLFGVTALSLAGYYGARDANDKVDNERAARIIANCERGNSTNRGVLNFIAATISIKPLVAPLSGNVDVDNAIAVIIGQVNSNYRTRNEAIAEAQRRYFPIIDCISGKVLPPPPLSTTTTTGAP